MGLYSIDCHQCKKPFVWFSGNTGDQRCPECKSPKPEAPTDNFKRCSILKDVETTVSASANESPPAQAPRAMEWWISSDSEMPMKNKSGGSMYIAHTKLKAPTLTDIRVIEYAAYENVSAENHSLRKDYEALGLRVNELQDEVDNANRLATGAMVVREKLERELAEAKREVKQSLELNRMSLLANAYELERQKARSAALVEALERIVNIERGIYCCDDERLGIECENFIIAREALAKFKEGK